MKTGYVVGIGELLWDMLSLCGTTPQEKSQELVARYGLQYLILTCGAGGSHIFTPAGEVSFLETRFFSSHWQVFP